MDCSGAGARWTAELKIIASDGAPNDNYGGSVSAAGDVNGDGYQDLIIGAHGVNSQLGAAYVYNGGPFGIDAASEIRITSPLNNGLGRFGDAVSAAGDVNGDGFRAWSTTTYRLNEVLTVLVQRTCRNHFRCGARSASLKVKFRWAQPEPATVGRVDSGTSSSDVSGAGDVNGAGLRDETEVHDRSPEQIAAQMRDRASESIASGFDFTIPEPT